MNHYLDTIYVDPRGQYEPLYRDSILSKKSILQQSPEKAIDIAKVIGLSGLVTIINNDECIGALPEIVSYGSRNNVEVIPAILPHSQKPIGYIGSNPADVINSYNQKKLIGDTAYLINYRNCNHMISYLGKNLDSLIANDKVVISVEGSFWRRLLSGLYYGSYRNLKKLKVPMIYGSGARTTSGIDKITVTGETGSMYKAIFKGVNMNKRPRGHIKEWWLSVKRVFNGWCGRHILKK